MKSRKAKISGLLPVTMAGACLVAAMVEGAEPDTSQFGFVSDALPPSGEALLASTVPHTGNREERMVMPEWLHFDLSVQSLYDDNVFLSDDGEESAWVNRVMPAVRFFNAEPDAAVWTFEGAYSPVWTTYSGSSVDNSFDHAVAAALRYNGTRLKAAASASYRELTGNDRYIRDVFTTATTRAELLMNYEMTGRTSLESRLLWEDIDRQDTGTRIYDDQSTLALQVSTLWEASALTKIGPSIRIGYTESDLSPDRTFLDLLVRAEYESSALLKFSGQAGAQWLTFDGDRDSYWRPSVTLTGQYDINPLWRLVFSAYSRNNAAPSVLNADLLATGFNGSVRWKPTDFLQVSAGAGYERARYEFFNGAPDRTDDYTYAELLVKAGREGAPLAIEMFYRHRLSDSSGEDLDFQNNQAGVQISHRF